MIQIQISIGKWLEPLQTFEPWSRVGSSGAAQSRGVLARELPVGTLELVERGPLVGGDAIQFDTTQELERPLLDDEL